MTKQNENENVWGHSTCLACFQFPVSHLFLKKKKKSKSEAVYSIAKK
jgi:hypothetical protein